MGLSRATCCRIRGIRTTKYIGYKSSLVPLLLLLLFTYPIRFVVCLFILRQTTSEIELISSPLFRLISSTAGIIFNHSRKYLYSMNYTWGFHLDGKSYCRLEIIFLWRIIREGVGVLRRGASLAKVDWQASRQA